LIRGRGHLPRGAGQTVWDVDQGETGSQASRHTHTTHVMHSTTLGASPKAHSKRRINHNLPDPAAFGKAAAADFANEEICRLVNGLEAIAQMRRQRRHGRHVYPPGRHQQTRRLL